MVNLNYFSKGQIAELSERFSQLYSGVIYDALYVDIKPEFPYVLSRDITAAWDFDDVLCGPAFTVRGCTLPDRSPLPSKSIEMYESLYEGCVEMISSGLKQKISIFGEITAAIVQRHGAVGTITDACTRDVKLIRQNNYKVFSAGVSMIDSVNKFRIVEYQTPIPLDGEDGDVWVNPGDYIFADTDGVLIIPHKDTWKVLEIAEKRTERENRIRKLVSYGVSPREIREKEGRW